jgi:uncharacterized membrane protein YoaK (UPF0700 family)
MTAFGCEAILLLGSTLASIVAVPSDSTRLCAVIVLTGLAMGLRNATVRKIAQPDLTPTVLTLTITGLAADSSFAGGSNPRWQRRAISILLMFAGAFVGALLLRRSLALPFGAATVFTICGMVAFYGNPRLESGETISGKVRKDLAYLERVPARDSETEVSSPLGDPIPTLQEKKS